MDLEKVILATQNLTPAEQRIARFILEKPEEIITMTGKEMELKLYVSKSAIYRFCKKIGVEGFNELKLEIASGMRSTQEEEQIGQVSANLPFSTKDSYGKVALQLSRLYEQTIRELADSLDEQLLDQAVSICTNHSPVYIFTHPHNAPLASVFQEKMLEIGYEVIVMENTQYAQNMAHLIRQEACAILLSYTGETEHVAEILQTLRDREIPSILISRLNDPVISSLASCQIRLSGREMLEQRVGQFASDTEIHFILDVLYGCMLNQDRARAFYYMTIHLHECGLPQISKLVEDNQD